YFLYGASNFGSMLGLALYPTVVEPWLQVSPQEGGATWPTQVHLWTLGYAIFVGLVVGCAVIVWQALVGKATSWAEARATSVANDLVSPSTAAPVPVAASATAITSAPKRRGKRIGPALVAPAASVAVPPSKPVALNTLSDDITLWRRLRWIGLAAAPSSLMLGVTTYMTTDIAAVPFFLVIPPALFFFFFILFFSCLPALLTGTPHLVRVFSPPCFV